MHANSPGSCPSSSFGYKAGIAFDINELKRRARVILGHNYMEPALYHS